jgi:hypothetical protein
MFLGLTLALASWWGLIPAALASGLLVLRTSWEDRLLQAELSGYSDYVRLMCGAFGSVLCRGYGDLHIAPSLGLTWSLVSRVTPVHTAQRNCTRDGGWPFEFGNQVSISSHRKLLSSKATVVNVAETSGHDPGRHGRERRAQANRCGSVEMRLGDVKTGG